MDSPFRTEVHCISHNNLQHTGEKDILLDVLKRKPKFSSADSTMYMCIHCQLLYLSETRFPFTIISINFMNLHAHTDNGFCTQLIN